MKSASGEQKEVPDMCNQNITTLSTWVFEPVQHFPRYRKRKGGVILVRNDGKLLVVQCYGCTWGFPKGTCNENESYLEGALRELREETGVELKPEDLVDLEPLQVYKDAKYYIARYDNPVDASKIEDTQEITRIGWMCIDCIQNLENVNCHTKRILSVPQFSSRLQELIG